MSKRQRGKRKQENPPHTVQCVNTLPPDAFYYFEFPPAALFFVCARCCVCASHRGRGDTRSRAYSIKTHLSDNHLRRSCGATTHPRNVVILTHGSIRALHHRQKNQKKTKKPQKKNSREVLNDAHFSLSILSRGLSFLCRSFSDRQSEIFARVRKSDGSFLGCNSRNGRKREGKCCCTCAR